MTDAISAFLKHTADAKAGMDGHDRIDNRTGRSVLDHELDGEGVRLAKLLARCPICHGQGFTEEGRPTVRTACAACKSSGKFPTTAAVAILELLEHVRAPQLASANCTPESIAGFNADALRTHQEYQANEREAREKKAALERAMALIANEPERLEALLAGKSARK